MPSRRVPFLTTALIVSFTALSSATLPPLNSGRVDDHFKNVTYDPAVPTVETVLGFPLGSRPVHYEEAIKYLKALDDYSPRAELVETGQTYEGRPLYYFVVGSEKNFAAREQTRANLAALANPSASGDVPNLEGILGTTPDIVWLSYSIHGDEISGVDASLWVAYHMLASQDQATKEILDSVLVFIDPSENPDGRERFLEQIFAFNGRIPSSTAGDLQHSGFWPWGRANHYLFDMNRDWLPLVHPETNARVKAILSWNPQVVVDAHEMEPYGSYLMSPPREPINPNTTADLKKWWNVFAADQGAEFDRRGWSYYTGDWNEQWYPGYGSSWCMFAGAVGILYEQAGANGSLVKRPDGSIHDYPLAVAQQAVSSLANLVTAAKNRRSLLSDYAKFHREGVLGRARDGLNGAYVFVPGGNPGREAEFLSVLKRHGLRVEKSQGTFQASVVTDLGERVNRTFPTGTYLVPMNQPRALLAQAVLEFDPHLTPAFLEEERRSQEKRQGTRLYEVSGWSLAQGYDLDVNYAESRPGVSTAVVDQVELPAEGQVTNPDAPYGFLLPVRDDRSMIALTRLLAEGVNVRVAHKPFVNQNVPYEPGTLLFRRAENASDLVAKLEAVAKETGLTFAGTSTNYSSTGIDLGSEYFGLLRNPQIGLFMGGLVDFTSAGSLWYLMDYRLGLRYSLLDVLRLGDYDLAQYNVLVLPNYWSGGAGLRQAIGDGGMKALKDWVSAGGTLIAVGEAAMMCADSASGLSSTREYGSVLDKLADYDHAFSEEKAAFTATVDTNAIWRGPAHATAAKEEKPAEKPDIETLKKRNEKARLFNPQGVIMRLVLNPENWLSFGTGGHANAMFATGNALLAKDPVEVAARVADGDKMRLSGLLWPEARERWANTAYCTRESMGKGQVILFADEPFFRAYFHGTGRLFENAVLFGPGLGTSHPAPW
jgi:hypothetical protein